MPAELGSFDFSFSGILASFIFGVIGLYMFRHGKKSSDMRLLIIGLTLMIYPYFTSGPVMDWVLGCGLCGLAYFFRNR